MTISSTKLVVGDVQSGKTRFIIDVAVRNIQNGISTVVVVRNSKADYIQLCSRIAEQHASVRVVRADYPMTIKRALNIPTIIIALGNHSQISRLVNTQERSVYDLIVDEADVYFDSVSQRSCHLQLLTPRLKYLVTATPLPILKTIDGLTGRSVIMLDSSENYKGWNDMQISDLSNITELDTLAPFEDDGFKHPIVLLERQHRKTYQFEIHNRLMGTDWVSIVYNADGIVLSHTSIRQRPVIGGVKGKRTLNGYLFPNLQIHQALQYLRDLDPEVQRFKRISIVAGVYANRGISFCSTDYKWHLTHQCVPSSNVTSFENAIQMIRMCGVYTDNIPLKVYMPSKTSNYISKGMQKQSNILRSILENPDQDVKECMRLLGVVNDSKLSSKYERNMSAKGPNCACNVCMDSVDTRKCNTCTLEMCINCFSRWNSACPQCRTKYK